jgi:hypothetical protein
VSAGICKRLARSAVGLCVTIMPREQRRWAEAMKGEIAAIEDSRLALSYALGCVFACGKERMLDMNLLERSTHIGVPIVMLILAIFPGLAALRNTAVDPAAGLVLALLAAIFVTTAIWSLWRGPLALVQAASSMLVVNLVALFSMRSASALTSRWPNIDLYRALAAEGVVIWAALLLGGIWLADRQRRVRSKI